MGLSAQNASAAVVTAQAQIDYQKVTQTDYNTLLSQFNKLEGKRFSQWDYSEGIKLVQKSITYLGYQPGKADGILGPQTSASLVYFQKDHQMKVNGVFGPDTFYAIRYALQVNPPKISKPISNGTTQVIPPVAQPVSSKPAPVPQPVSKPAPAPVSSVKENSYTANPAYGVSQKDLDMLARIVYGEARGETFEGKVAVAAVVLNRTKSPLFPSTIAGVIFEPWAYTCVNDGQYYLTPDAVAYQALQAAVKGWDPTNGALFYWNPVTATSPWVWSRPIIKTIGQHVFAI